MTAITIEQDAIAEGLQAYIGFFETLAPASLARLGDLVAADVHFRDPFNDVHGLAAMRRVFEASFEDCSEMRFIIDSVVRQDATAFLTWRFFFKPTRLNPAQPWEVVGVSELHFTPAGKVAAHLDHWDSGSQFYARLPLIGAVVRWLRRRLSVKI